MIIHDTITDVRRYTSEARALGQRTGFVPTMGYLHAGHLDLVRRARAECDQVVISIYVNPTQFGPNEDLAAYPRDMPRDLALLEEAGVDLVFTPTNAVMYPAGHATTVHVAGVTETLCGPFRPGHFDGVATIVAKLFAIVQPHRAYFGEKDRQQLVMIQRMTADLDLDIEIVPVPTHREPDGLAMSSRNAYLTPAERAAAICLWQALSAATALWNAGERDPRALKAALDARLAAEPLARPQYAEVVNAATLHPWEGLAEGPTVAALAVYVGRTRLIDNVLWE